MKDQYGVEYSDDIKTLIQCPIDFEGEFIVPEGVVEIDPKSFLFNERLTSIVIPTSVKKFGIDASSGKFRVIDFNEQKCNKLRHIKYGEWNINFVNAKFGIFLDKVTGETSLVGWFDRELRVYIPQSATKLSELFQLRLYESLFYNCYARANSIMFIPNSIKEVHYPATYDYFRHDDINTHIYIDNYIENVTIENTDKWRNPKIKFRAPMPNSKPVNGKTLELTLAPTTHYRNNGLWSSPITIHSDFVAYITPLSMKCFGEQEHEGCHIVLLHRGEGPTQYDPEAGHPSVDVWESYEFVLNKLHQAGWEV